VKTTRWRRWPSGRACPSCAVHRPDLRLTVDTLHDLAYMRRVLSAFADDTIEPPLAAIVAAAAASALTTGDRGLRRAIR